MKILFTGELSSVHTARWINQLAETGWDIHLFQLGLTPQVSEALECGTVHLPSPFIHRVRQKFFPRLNARLRQQQLNQLIEQLQPDIVHSLGLNVNNRNLALPVLLAKQALDKKFTAKWLYSSWGTDFDHFPYLSAENERGVKAVAQGCDYYIAECQRDERLAREFGFRGQFLGYFPAFGGVLSDQHAQLRAAGSVAARLNIFLKGRDHGQPGGDPVGRAMTALQAFADLPDVLKTYHLKIAQATPNMAAAAKSLIDAQQLQIDVLPRLPYDEILRLKGSSRIFMALTVNDGLPSSLVEAMSLGAFPIHSDLEPIREWIQDGQNGLLVDPEDVAGVKRAIQRALNDDELVEQAARINAQLVMEKLSDAVVKPRMIAMYQSLLAPAK